MIAAGQYDQVISRALAPWPPLWELRTNQACWETMEDAKATFYSRDDGSQPHSLILGTALSAALALIFGLFLWTALDAARPAPREDVARAAALPSINSTAHFSYPLDRLQAAKRRLVSP